MTLLAPLFESDKKEKILFFLYAHGEGYAREIARAFRFNLNTVQNQLKKLEGSGILISRLRGKVRMFSFDPRYPLKKELEALFKKAMMYLSEEDVKTYYWPRPKDQHIEQSSETHNFNGAISFAPSNPWGEIGLNRFMPPRNISKIKKEEFNPPFRKK
jgi:DNA-binding transcriptional ArsR family regulator